MGAVALRRPADGTFLDAPYLPDLEGLRPGAVAVLGVPFDGGTTYRSGARLGPEAIRWASRLLGARALAAALGAETMLFDLGDVPVVQADLEESFRRISEAVAAVVARGAFPVILGGDHSIGYPDVYGIAGRLSGNLGIIHFDRHADTQERDLDERMHSTPWFWATQLPNVSPRNLVQIGIGGHYVSRPSVRVSLERGTTILTMRDVERLGLEGTAELALETAWAGAQAVYLSFDIDCVDPGFAPGTGTPEPGGLLPREALALVRAVARRGLCGVELVEVAPPYDVGHRTAALAARILGEVLAALAETGHLAGKRAE